MRSRFSFNGEREARELRFAFENGGDQFENNEQRAAAPEVNEADLDDLEHPEQTAEGEVGKATEELQKDKGKMTEDLAEQAQNFDQFAAENPEMADDYGSMAEQMRNFSGQLNPGKGPQEALDDTQEPTTENTEQTETGEPNTGEQPKDNKEAKPAFDIDKALEEFMTTMDVPKEKQKEIIKILKDPEVKDYLMKSAQEYIDGIDETTEFSMDELGAHMRKSIDSAPPNVAAKFDAIKAVIGDGEVKKKNGEPYTLKDFAKELGAFFKMITDALREAGILKEEVKEGGKEAGANEKGLKDANDAFDRYKKSASTSSLEERRSSVTKQKTAVEGQIKTGEKQYKEAQDRVTKITDQIAQTTDQISEKEKAGVTGKELEDLKTSLTELQTEKTIAEGEVAKREKTLNGFKKLRDELGAELKKIDEEKAAQPKETPEEPKQEEPDPSPSEPEPESPKGEQEAPQTEDPAPPPTKEEAPAPEPQNQAENTTVSPPDEWRVQPDRTKLNAWVQTQDTMVEGRNPKALRAPLAKLGSDLMVENSSQTVPIIKAQRRQWELGFAGFNHQLRLKGDPSVSVMLPSDVKTITQSIVEQYATKALEYSASEKRDDAGMGKGFEVADSEPMGYIEFMDLSDRLTKSISAEGQQFPSLLAERYNVVRAPGSSIDASKGRNPMAALRAQVKTLTENGVKNVYLSVYAHGSDDAMHFGDNDVKPSEFTALFAEFPDCKFTLNTISCYGGGISEEMRRFKDHEGAQNQRVSVFTQTKGDVVNIGTKNTENFATLYNAALAKYLAQGVNGRPGPRLTYGQAHLKADRFARMGQGTDAEVNVSMPGDMSRRTAGTMDPNQYEGMA